MGKGIFVNILKQDTEIWRRQFDFATSLENVEHCELWIEYDLNDDEIDGSKLGYGA
jgi:hypothetical protein